MFYFTKKEIIITDSECIPLNLLVKGENRGETLPGEQIFALFPDRCEKSQKDFQFWLPSTDFSFPVILVNCANVKSRNSNSEQFQFPFYTFVMEGSRSMYVKCSSNRRIPTASKKSCFLPQFSACFSALLCFYFGFFYKERKEKLKSTISQL